MKIIKIFLVFFALIYMTIGTASAGVLGQCLRVETKVVFSNGIGSTEAARYDAVEDLTELVEKKLKIDGVTLNFIAANSAAGYEHNTFNKGDCDALLFGYQNNPTHSFGVDLFEATVQSFNEDTSGWWDIFFFIKVIPESFKDKVLELSSRYEETALIDNTKIQEHITNHTKFLDTYVTVNYPDARIISVSHSQGNYYSNTIKEGLPIRLKSHYKRVAVASPSSLKPRLADHTTSYLDLVIKVIRATRILLLQPQPLSANQFGFNVFDLTGHSFITSYLKPGSNIETKITEDITGLIPIIDYSSPPPVESPKCTGDLIWTGYGCEYD